MRMKHRRWISENDMIFSESVEQKKKHPFHRFIEQTNKQEIIVVEEEEEGEDEQDDHYDAENKRTTSEAEAEVVVAKNWWKTLDHEEIDHTLLLASLKIQWKRKPLVISLICREFEKTLRK